MDPRGASQGYSDSALMSSLENSKYDDVSGEVDALATSLRARKRAAPSATSSSSSSSSLAASALHGAVVASTSGPAGTPTPPPGSGTPHQVSTPTGTDMDPEEYDDDDDDDEYTASKARGALGVGGGGVGGGVGGNGTSSGNPGSKRPGGGGGKRHNWQTKYEMEFGLLPIERDAVTNDVTLAMCGFCKAFGRESKYEQMVQADADLGESKKRRRRSLTTTKFFRAFRVDNIRSHLQGAHPRRWAEYDMLPKQETIRTRFLQMHANATTGAAAVASTVGVPATATSSAAVVTASTVAADYHQYDGLSMVDDVALHAAGLHDHTELAYTQTQPSSSSLVSTQVLGENQQLQANVLSHSASATLVSAAATAQLVSPLGYPGMTKPSSVKEYQQVKRNNRALAGVSIESTPPSTCTASTSSSNNNNNNSSCSASRSNSTTTNSVGAGVTSALNSSNAGAGFDYEKHLLEQLALDRERLAFEKSKFKKEVELRERELAQREKHMELRRLLFEQEKDLLEERTQVDSERLVRLMEVFRQGILAKLPSSTSVDEASVMATSSTTI